MHEITIRRKPPSPMNKKKDGGSRPQLILHNVMTSMSPLVQNRIVQQLVTRKVQIYQKFITKLVRVYKMRKYNLMILIIIKINITIISNRVLPYYQAQSKTRPQEEPNHPKAWDLKQPFSIPAPSLIVLKILIKPPIMVKATILDPVRFQVLKQRKSQRNSCKCNKIL